MYLSLFSMVYNMNYWYRSKNNKEIEMEFDILLYREWCFDTFIKSNIKWREHLYRIEDKIYA